MMMGDQRVTYRLRQHDLVDETGVGMDIHAPFWVRYIYCIGSYHDFSAEPMESVDGQMNKV